MNVCHKFNCILLSRSYKGFIVGKFYAWETLKRFLGDFEIVSFFGYVKFELFGMRNEENYALKIKVMENYKFSY